MTKHSMHLVRQYLSTMFRQNIYEETDRLTKGKTGHSLDIDVGLGIDRNSLMRAFIPIVYRNQIGQIITTLDRAVYIPS